MEAAICSSSSCSSKLGPSSSARPAQALQPRLPQLPLQLPPPHPAAASISTPAAAWRPQHSRQHQQQPAARKSTLLIPRASKAANSSFDAEDDLDSDLAEELSRFRSPDAWNKVAQRLDMVWKIGRERGKRAVCGCCEGTGEEECAWCHGTGAMMVGDTLFRSADGASHCPVCKGKGYVPCENCRGTGYRASWMQGPDQCKAAQ